MVEYDFKKQLELGKRWEEIVFAHLLAKESTIHVKDMSEDKIFQPLWIDGMCIYVNNDTWIYHSMFFDVKTDFQVHRTGNLFIEVGCSTEGYSWCMMSTKAEYFLYYDPIRWKLYHLPIYPVRQWYMNYGISKKHITVNNVKWYKTEGIAVSLDELESAILGTLLAEDIAKLEGIL